MATGSTVKLKLLIDKKGNKVLFAEASKLYESIENLNETYIQPNQNKNTLLNPTSPLSPTKIPLLLSDNQELSPRKVYFCPNSYHHVSDIPNLVCPHCRVKMNTQAYPVVNSAAANSGEVVEGGFVKGVVTYMVKPVSTITMLNKFNIKDVGALDERVVDIGINEGLKLLEASMECKNVLTSVFLGKKL